jgi:hypothetical protein
MSFLNENFWAEKQMDRMGDWAEKRKLAEKYLPEIRSFLVKM